MHNNASIAQSLFPELSASDLALVDQALLLVEQACADNPPTQHSPRPKGMDVAGILTAVHIDMESILAAVLSDSRLEGRLDETGIAKQFGPVVASLVKDVNWLNKVSIYKRDMANQPNQTEILRRMLLSMTHDVRAVLIKLAYRIQRLRGLSREDADIRNFIARETLDIYAPLANRLGISQFKWELEDLAFRYLDPERYRSIAESLADKRVRREACIDTFLRDLRQTLDEHHLKAKVYGRPKHIYSIWCKMRRKQLPIEELYDLLAVRVIVDDVTACYTVLGLAHGRWQYIPKEFDDYIANPKENGYQSLHTVVVDTQGNRIEIQIRTRAMHEFAELGVAAHWRYKEGGGHNAASEKNITSLRLLLEDRGQDNLLESFHTELFSDRVFVLTPTGKLVDLIKGSTPLDFAYAIHTDIGHGCRGAKINGQIKPLTHVLKSGEQVEIITVKNGQPSRNWLDPNLGYLKTPRAIGKVKSWFKQQELGENIAAGKSLLDKESKRLGLKNVDPRDLAKHFKMADVDHLYQALGRGDINNRQLAGALKIPELAPVSFKLSPSKTNPKSSVTVADMDNVVTSLAHCCSPVAGDDIVGYITHTRGITIHRADCANILHLNPEQQTHLVTAEWSGRHRARHSVPIVIEALSGDNLLIEVSQLLHFAKVHITDAALKTHPDQSATLNMQIQIDNTDQLSLVLGRISQLENVTDVRRRV
ncbi:bifunctional (p)ppGpp synthetase/guanosine-3',5'-bis(diphosphate) 3'-pyrophosphohydrolase [Methylomonas sp. SURF-2]|uniref:GTP pyrophosphokinase n=1 Tax=Methylomonas subterranea TaxID=2952225 RepID=A0ABT1TCB4_9GAMM|nr:bifunctional (p)ppGpp synthetase/guanosine-3',5'-bis(diphosphate) 3'-pyrophosphohydrolase [Methylomonas sp. SURF-2]MCQ8102886.1 bifunctional (p)ppGpp synthetase/guanosine-3',5'-bis(diphosphate) 3'-pyrophosphohydrolase [Methylomonas sp. SURF-2]